MEQNSQTNYALGNLLGPICDLGNVDGCARYPTCGCYERWVQRKRDEFKQEQRPADSASEQPK